MLEISLLFVWDKLWFNGSLSGPTWTTIRIVDIRLEQQYQFLESPGAPEKLEHLLQVYIKNTEKPHKTFMYCIYTLGSKRPIHKVQCSRCSILETNSLNMFWDMCLLQLAAMWSPIFGNTREKTCEAEYLTCKFFILMKNIYHTIGMSFHVDRIKHRAYGINLASSLY